MSDHRQNYLERHVVTYLAVNLAYGALLVAVLRRFWRRMHQR